MKHCITLFCIFCYALGLAAQKQVKIDIDIRGIGEKDTVVLSWGANNKSMNPKIAQKALSHGCTFQLPLSEPRLILVQIKGCVGSYELLVCPDEDISFFCRARKVETDKKPEILMNHIRVKGASMQEQYTDIMKDYQNHVDSIDLAVFNEYKDISKLIEKAKEQKDEQAIANMYTTTDGQSYIERVMSTFQERQDYMKATILRQKDSFLGPLLLLRLAGRLDKEHRPLFDAFSEEAKASYYGREVKDEVFPSTLIGDLAPTLQLMDIEGKEELLALAQHGKKYMLIDFWASWCEPCRKEMSTLKHIYAEYHKKGLDIVSISVDHHIEDWQAAVKEIDTPWKHYLDKSRQGIAEYKVQYIPSIFLVDTEGKILVEKLRGKELEDYLGKLFQ